MSRPPRPLFHISTAGDGSAFAAHRQFLPIEFAELLRLQQSLAESEAQLGLTEEEGDFAYTLMELSALIGHTLGLYQNLYAREAYLGTAETTKSLFLHARRLAYAPDQGLAASGYAVLTVGKGLKGQLPAGFALASSPRGEIKAQTFETIKDLDVDAARNEALPVARARPAMMTFSGSRGAFRLAGIELNLARGGYGILERESDNRWEPVVIVAADEVEAGVTRITIDLLDTTSDFADTEQQLADADGSPVFRFLAMPKERLQRFGWNADPVEFPAMNLASSVNYTAPLDTEPVDTTRYGYQVTRESGGEHRVADIYLNTSLIPNLLDQLVIARVGVGMTKIVAHRVTEQGSASVAFRRGKVFEYATGGTPANKKIVVETQISNTGTYLRLAAPGGTAITRASVSLQAPIYADWQFATDVLATEPNPDPVSAPLVVDADFGDFRPGNAAVFETLDGTFGQAVEIQSLVIPADGTTELRWVPLTDPPSTEWTLDNIRIFGNIAQVTHGETAEEVLGGSDGVTPFQRFELKKAPLTQVPSPAGGDPAIEVRVNDVAWMRVDDFFASRAEDRHYRIEIDENQKTSIIFGNGRTGAIPPSGRKHIRAIYRQGLGANGNVDRGAAGRIKKAHPLIDRAINPTSIIGGANPAALDDLQRQATRFVRTFDRAVSIQDHADLALLYPGVARAAARFANRGIEVVVATADGGLPPLATVEAFLNARRDTTLLLKVSEAEAVDLFLTLMLEHDPAYLTENVRRAVQDALFGQVPGIPGMFTFPARNFGQAAHLSEVYQRVAAVAGVTFVDVTRFRIDDDVGVMDVLQVNARQWLRLPPANLALSITPGAVV